MIFINKKLRDDSGIAMVTSILVTMVMASLAVVAFNLSKHDLDQSANDRRRVQAIHAAEAGLDSYVQYLATAPITGTSCSLPGGTQTLDTTPPSTFVVSARFFSDINGTTSIACAGGVLSGTSTPGSVIVTSVGTSSGITRTMESLIGLESSPGEAPLETRAVFSYSDVSWAGGTSSGTGADDGDVFVNGNYQGNGGSFIDGHVEATGTISLGGGGKIGGNAIARNAVSITGSSGVLGDGRSSTAGITGGSKIDGTAYYCTGASPKAGAVQECPNPPLPVARPFPTFTYTESDWTGSPANYTLHTYTAANCGTAVADIKAGFGTGNHLVRITNSSCALSFNGNPKDIPMQGNLAIISNGSLTTSGGNQFLADQAGRRLHLMFSIAATPGTCNNAAGINLNSGGPAVSPVMDTLLYTPCLVDVGGTANSPNGQIIGGNVNLRAGSGVTYKTVLIPGSDPTGFQQSNHYRREIVNS